MDRSLAGRIGRVEAALAPSAGARSRRRAPAARRRERERLLHAQWQRLRAVLAFISGHRRLRIALVLALALAALTLGGWTLVRHSSLSAVRQVRISGVHGPDAAAIEAALTAAARRMSTLGVRAGELRAAVAQFAVVRDVQARASFPHGLQIHVSEQLPVAALAAGGVRTALAADGVALGPALLSSSLPTLTASVAPAPGQRVGDASLQEELVVLAAAPAPLAPLVTKAYSAQQGVAVVMRSGVTAYFGDSSRPHAKWLALALVLANERSAGATYVDVRVPDRPAAGYAPGSGPQRAQGSQSATSTSAGAATQEATAAALAAAVGREGGSGSPSAQAQKASEEASSTTSSETRSHSSEGAASPSETTSGAAAGTPESGASGGH
jgi:cell division protein FtsQ